MRGIVLGCPISAEMHDKGHRLQHAARATAVVECLLLSTAVASSSGGAHTRRVTGATPFRDACGFRPRPVRSSEGEPRPGAVRDFENRRAPPGAGLPQAVG